MTAWGKGRKKKIKVCNHVLEREIEMEEEKQREQTESKKSMDREGEEKVKQM